MYVCPMTNHVTTHRSDDRHINNPTYSSDLRALRSPSTEQPSAPLGYEEHVYDAICSASECEKKKQKPEANTNVPSNIYDNTQNGRNDDNADRISIKSDDIKYEDMEGQCTSDVKQSKAYYSKNSKPKPQPKPRHSKKPTTAPVAPTHYDVPTNNRYLPPADEGDYTTLDVTHSSNGASGGNVYQELIVQRSPPPGYDVPSNIPATSTTLEYATLSS